MPTPSYAYDWQITAQEQIHKSQHEIILADLNCYMAVLVNNFNGRWTYMYIDIFGHLRDNIYNSLKFIDSLISTF